MPTEPSLAPLKSRSGKSNVLLLAVAVVVLVVGGIVVYLQSPRPAPSKDKAAADRVANADAKSTDDLSNDSDAATGTQKEAIDVESSDGGAAVDDPVDTQAVDPAEVKRLERIAKIKSGDWSTRQMLALSAARPYMIDFHVSINGKSLETAEREQLDAIADQLLSPTIEKSAPMQSDAMKDAPLSEGGEVGEETIEGQQTDPAAETDTETLQPSTQQDADTEDTLAGGDPAAPTDAMAAAAAGMSSEPIAWQTLVDKPLVASGWLGNLIADDERSDQLISMYDSERDDIVSRDELREFLSRGLSRSSALQVADIGNSPDSRDASPWGPLDTNEDYVLDAQENSQIMQKFMSLDRDGDGTLTLAEARPAMMSQTSMMQNASVLSAKTLYALDSQTDSDTATSRSRQLSNLAGRLIEHYTFLSELSAEQWPSYPAHRWKELDKDESGGVDRYEMKRLFDLPADVSLYLRFDPEFEGGYVVYAEPIRSQPEGAEAVESGDDASDAARPAASELTWTETDQGGRLDAAGLCLQIVVEDLFTSTSRELVLSQVRMALKNQQLADALQTRFELSDEAIEFADQDGDGELSDGEANALWQWLTARQGTRLAARWMLAPEPWFQLLDKDANNRIGKDESEQFVASFESVYGQGEAVLGAGDPLLVQFVVRRSDPRFEGFSNPGQTADPGPEMASVDWFDAMDLDRDGAIDEEEFLGDMQDFTGLDANNDGFLRRAELYVP